MSVPNVSNFALLDEGCPIPALGWVFVFGSIYTRVTLLAQVRKVWVHIHTSFVCEISPVHPFSSPTDFFFYISHHDLLQEAIVCKICLNEGYLWLSYIIIYVKRQNNKIAKAIKSEHIIALCSITAWFHPACCLSLLLQDLCLCQVLQEFVCGKLYKAIYGEVSHFVAPFPPYESPVHQNRTE